MILFIIYPKIFLLIFSFLRTPIFVIL